MNLMVLQPQWLTPRVRSMPKGGAKLEQILLMNEDNREQVSCYAQPGRSRALPVSVGGLQSELLAYFYPQIVSAFMAALAAAHVLYEVVPTSFILAFVGKNSDGYCDNFCSLMEHLCEAMFCTT